MAINRFSYFHFAIHEKQQVNPDLLKSCKPFTLISFDIVNVYYKLITTKYISTKYQHSRGTNTFNQTTTKLAHTIHYTLYTTCKQMLVTIPMLSVVMYTAYCEEYITKMRNHKNRRTSISWYLKVQPLLTLRLSIIIIN